MHTGKLVFAQLTFRESLRDIETCLRAHSAKLYHLGMRGGIARSTLADANENRDWRSYQDFALTLIHTARKLYAADSFGLELTHTVYALDSTTIDLRGNIPTFIHITQASKERLACRKLIALGQDFKPLPGLGPVDLEVRTVSGEDAAKSGLFCGPYHRRVRQIHRPVCVFQHQVAQPRRGLFHAQRAPA